jgi:DNA-binding NarL/FixJ family response regulator
MELIAAQREDLDLSIVIPIAGILVELGDESEQQLIRYQAGLYIGLIAMRTMDEDVRARWFRSPLGHALSEIAGSLASLSSDDGDREEARLDDDDLALLRLVMQGMTNAEIGSQMGLDDDEVRRRLGEVFARIGASSRTEATALAFRSGAV